MVPKLNVLNITFGSGKIAQSVKCLPWKQQDMSLILSTQVKRMAASVWPRVPSIRKVEVRGPMEHAGQPVQQNW